MGWLFCEPTREALVKRLLRNCETDHSTLVDHAVNGNEFYAVIKKKDTGLRFILVALMQGARGNFHHEDIRWGYKDMDESAGPYAYNCPERLLAQSDCQHERSVAWRQQCREHRQQRGRRAKFVSGLKPGDKVRIGDKDAVFEHRIQGRYKANMVCNSDRGRFRYKPSQLSPPN